MVILLDTGYLFSLYNEDDKDHTYVKNSYDKLLNGDFGIPIIMDYVFDELVTLIQYRTKRNDIAIEVGNLILSDCENFVQFARVDKSTFSKACVAFMIVLGAPAATAPITVSADGASVTVRWPVIILTVVAAIFAVNMIIEHGYNDKYDCNNIPAMSEDEGTWFGKDCEPFPPTTALNSPNKGVSNTYSFSSIQGGSNAVLFIDWGDGTTSTIENFAEVSERSTSHTYTSSGLKYIKARILNQGQYSPWSNSLEILVNEPSTGGGGACGGPRNPCITPM